MQATVINVGYGDAILVETSDRFRLLLDGGSALPSEFAGSPYRIRAADFLKRRDIRRLDAVVISHIHEDHVCGLEAVLEQTEVGRICVPYPAEPFLAGCELTPAAGAARSVPLYTAALNAYRRILLRAREAHIPITVVGAGDTLELGAQARMRVLAPQAEVLSDYMELVEQAYGRREDAAAVTACLTRLDALSNRTSLLLRFELGDHVLLSAADSCPGEWSQVPKFLFKNVNVLKLPHHGQIDSISEQFMGDMPLSLVITTSASDRRYNSANPAVYQRLSALFPPERAPRFLFSDERDYPPYFSRPEGFQAITLAMDSGEVIPEFVKA
jgi:competence protein ComEC